jgi:hypothetical protein
MDWSHVSLDLASLPSIKGGNRGGRMQRIIGGSENCLAVGIWRGSYTNVPVGGYPLAS